MIVKSTVAEKTQSGSWHQGTRGAGNNSPGHPDTEKGSGEEQVHVRIRREEPESDLGYDLVTRI